MSIPVQQPDVFGLAVMPRFKLTLTSDTTKQGTVLNNRPSALTLTLANVTGAPVGLCTGDSLQIFLPAFYTDDDARAGATDLSGLPPTWNVTGLGTRGPTLTYTGPPYRWDAGGELSFVLMLPKPGNAVPTSDRVMVNLVVGNVPAHCEAPLATVAPPAPGNASLPSTIALSLDNRGVVYVTEAADPLANTLRLNIKNTGSAPLYTGTKPWTGLPKVTVSFVYGTTPGALAPSGDSAGTVGSPWSITARVAADNGNQWIAENPTRTSGSPTPTWVLRPASGNRGVVGTSDAANITFVFDNVVSYLLPGHTQMVLTFSGFMRDDAVHYDDAVFFLDLIKQPPPPTRGLLAFTSTAPPLFEVNEITADPVVPLSWTMLQVASTRLFSSLPGSEVTTTPYPSPGAPLQHAQRLVSLAGIRRTTPVFFTLQAFDGTQQLLNALQYTVLVQCNLFVDPADGSAYPVTRINGQLWTTKDLDRHAVPEKTPSGPGRYQLYDGREAKALTALLAQSGMGWRLPTTADWRRLVTPPDTAYARLTDHSAGAFGATLGGYNDSSGYPQDVGTDAYYWAYDTSSDTSLCCVHFSRLHNVIVSTTAIPEEWAMGIRLVREAA